MQKYAYVCIHMHTYAYIRIHMHTYACMHTYTHTHTPIYIHIYIHTHAIRKCHVAPFWLVNHGSPSWRWSQGPAAFLLRTGRSEVHRFRIRPPMPDMSVSFVAKFLQILWPWANDFAGPTWCGASPLKKWVHHRSKRNLGGLARSSATLIPLSHFLSSNLAARELSGKQGMPLIHSLTHLYWLYWVSRCFHCIPQSFAVALICPSCIWQPCTGEIRWTVSGAPRGMASTTTGYIP